MVKIHVGTLELFGGLTTVPLTKFNDDTLVSTIATVNIPPLSEAVIATMSSREPQAGEYMIGAEFGAPKASPMIVRALVDATNLRMPCRMKNPTDKPVQLRAGTTIGLL
jgi:hypothetical protein